MCFKLFNFYVRKVSKMSLKQLGTKHSLNVYFQL